MKTFLAAATLCALTFACDIQSLPVQVPMIPAGSKGLPHYRGSLLIITINKRGHRTIENRPIDVNKEMHDVFSQILARNPLSSIGIRADAEAPFEAVTTVILSARNAGVSKIFLVVGCSGRTEANESIVVEEYIEVEF